MDPVIGDLQRRFGRAVRAVRLQRGLTQEALAEGLGMHRTYWGAIERGERNLTLQTVEFICEQLGETPLDLLSAE